jgi:4-alpha-glucanotransferase
MFRRESGILLHPTSLPGRFGIGDLGPECISWIKFLDDAGQRLWQVLPLTPVGSGFSPYHCGSSFAGNTLLLSPERLHQQGRLSAEDLQAIELPWHSRLEPELLMRTKLPALQKAAEHFLNSASPEERDEFESFKAAERDWLVDYARYEAIRTERGESSWTKWPSDLKRRDAATLSAVDRELERAMARVQVLQFLFEQQWQSVRRLANLRKIRVIGDLPIFVALDSADVWAAQHLFQLDADGAPKVVAGVPPDYFSKTGQRWGNPLYAWEEHERHGFQWWKRRVARTLQMTDLLRIDHFRGFAGYWEIPAHEPTAINGRWVPAPGKALFTELERSMGSPLPIMAEDLGIITDDVVELRDHFGFPTMRVLQFSFTGEERLLPHNYPENCVAYTGTHDNDTTVGWYRGNSAKDSVETAIAVEEERDRVRRYYSTNGTDIQWTCIQRLMASKVVCVIAPFQDVLGLGSEARMNTPGTVGEHNWTWRFDWPQLQPKMLETLRQITRETQRNQA